MGVSTDGILFFGFDLGDEIPGYDNEEYEGDYERFVAEKTGLEFEGYGYWKEVEKLDCLIGYHCSDRYTCYYVAVRGRDFSASRGDPRKITPDELATSEGDIEKLRKFCEKMEIPWQEPSWCLASYWG